MFHETELCNRSMMMRGIHPQTDAQLQAVLEGLQDGDPDVLQRLLDSGLLVGAAENAVRGYAESLGGFESTFVVLSDVRTSNRPHARHAGRRSDECYDHPWDNAGNLFFYTVMMESDSKKTKQFIYLCLGAKR